MKKIAIIGLILVVLAILLIVFNLQIRCGGDIVCHAIEDYPPNCGEKGRTFTGSRLSLILLKD